MTPTPSMQPSTTPLCLHRSLDGGGGSTVQVTNDYNAGTVRATKDEGDANSIYTGHRTSQDVKPQDGSPQDADHQERWPVVRRPMGRRPGGR